MKKHIYAFICLILPASFLSASDPLPTSINTFASNFYKESFSHTVSNEVFSPYCLFNCLSMVYMGADGSTEDEIAQVLCLSNSNLAPSLNKLSSDLLPQSDLFQMNIANSLWLGKDATLLPDYRHKIESELEAAVSPIDFTSPKESAATINAWIKEQTRGLLDQVLSARDIVRTTQLMLVSALYFKGSWEKPFPAKNTKLASFYKDASSVKEVSMMEQSGIFSYYEDDSLQLLVMPFAGKNTSQGSIACFFALPKGSLQEIEASLELLPQWIESTGLARVDVSMPRFEIHPRYDLIPMLCNLGMPSAFSREADFSKISGSFDLLINKAIHEAVFSLNERGVTAAAVTAIGLGHACVHIEKNPGTEFRANHPFLFGIVDLKSNVMLFLGRVVDP